MITNVHIAPEMSDHDVILFDITMQSSAIPDGSFSVLIP